MADIYAKTYPDPTKPQKIVDEKYARLRTTPLDLTTTLAVNPIGDRLFLGRVPSNARLVDLGQITYGAFGGTAAMNLGFYHPKLTAAENTAAANKLWSAQSIAAASSRKVMHAPVLADLEKRVWQLAGLTKDPNVEFDIVGTLTAATANIATLHGEVTFTQD